jgi:hypothetical protein
MTCKSTLIASFGAVALVLAAGAASADPGAVRGAGLAPSRPAFPSFPRHHHRGGGLFPGPGIVYGATNDVREPVVVESPPVTRSDELRYTCVLDIPWDYVHRCPQYTTPR